MGLAQFVSQMQKAIPDALIVGGYVMLGAILTNNSPVTLADVTPIARLTGDTQAIVVPAASDTQTIGDLVEKLKADPGAGQLGRVARLVVPTTSPWACWQRLRAPIRRR